MTKHSSKDVDERINNALFWIIKIGIFAILFVPLVVGSQFYFPFIVLKNVVFRMVVEIIFAVYVVLAVRDARFRPKLNGLTLAVFLFFAIATVTTLFGINLHRNIWGNYERMGGLFRITHLFLYFFVLISTFKNKKDWMQFFTFSIFASSIMAIFAFAQWLNVSFILESAGGSRLTGTIGNAAYLAAYMLLNIFFILYFFFKDKEFDIKVFMWSVLGADVLLILHDILNKFNTEVSGQFISQMFHDKTFFVFIAVFHIAVFATYFLRKQQYAVRGFLALMFAFQFFILYSTKTRGAFLGFFAAVVLFCFLASRYVENKTFKKTATAILIVLIIFPVFLFFGKDTKVVQKNDLLRSFASISKNNITTESRLLTWKASFKTMTENPGRFFFGYGDESYYYVFNKNFPPEIYKDRGSRIWFDRAHNIIFDVWSNFGFIGLVSYTTVFLFSFLALFALFKKNKDFIVFAIFSCLLLAYFGQNFFVFDTLNTYILFYLVLAFIVFLWNASMEQQHRFVEKLKGYFLWPFSKRHIHPAQQALIAIVFVVMSASVFMFNIQLLRANNELYEAISLKYRNVHPDEVSKMFEKAIDESVTGRYEARQQYMRFAMELARAKDAPDNVVNPIVRKVEEHLRKSVQEEPLNVRHYLMLGSFYNNLAFRDISFADKAIDVLKKGIALSPTRPHLYLEIGQSHFIKQDFENGLTYFSDGLNLAPTVADAHIDTLYVFIVSGLYDLADQEFSYMKENIGTLSVDHYTRIIQAYEANGSYDKSVPIYEEFFEVYPNQVTHYSGLANAYANIGQIQKAKAVANEAVKKDPAQKKEIDEFLKLLNEKEQQQE